GRVFDHDSAAIDQFRDRLFQLIEQRLQVDGVQLGDVRPLLQDGGDLLVDDCDVFLLAQDYDRLFRRDQRRAYFNDAARNVIVGLGQGIIPYHYLLESSNGLIGALAVD